MDNNKRINGRYYVADCEHYGDLQQEMEWLCGIHKQIRISKHYWDGKDCGEAYIEFYFLAKYFVEIYSKVNATYSEDINDYITFKRETSQHLANVPFYNVDAFNKLRENFKYKFDATNVTISLFFEETAKVSNETIFDKAMDTLGADAKPFAYTKCIVDNNTFIKILFQIPIDNIDYSRIIDFGDYCLGSSGWLKRNRIYREMKTNSILKGLCNFSVFIDRVNKVRAKDTLPYVDSTSGYDKVVEIEYDRYMSENNIIKKRIDINGREYFLKMC